MAIHVALEHRTLYRFDRWTRLGPHVVRLRPAPNCRTPILAYSLRVEPEGHFINWQQDPFGNHLARLVFPDPARLLAITVDIVADMTVINPFDFFLDPTAERYPFSYDPALARDLAPYLTMAEPGRLLRQWLDEVKIPADGEATVDFLVGVNQRVQQAVAYTTRFEPGVQTPDETLEKGLGSCRDSGWLLTQILRGLGLAARFVSGYLVQLKADEAPLDGPAGPTADFTDLHAWCEVYIPGAGWIGLDPTSGLLAGEGHIPLACTPDPSSAAAVTGVIEPGEVTFEYANVVRRVSEDPRVTFPYTEGQWAAIDALGRSVDAVLAAGDVRLTHGGEPTFVSVDGTEAPEWSTAADGDEKRTLARDLTRRLAERFSSGGIVHHGQGKWYPGEPLPRWQMAVVWRADGVPLWTDPSLLAEPWAAGRGEAVDAQRLAGAIAAQLGVPADCCVPGYEDAMHRLWTEARLPGGEAPPADVDPTDPRLAEADARRRLVADLDAAHGDPVGWAIPLHYTYQAGGGWATTRWNLRRGHLVLLPGDSPMGLRLPLDSLTWTPAPPATERSTFEPRGVLAGPTSGSPPKAALVVPADEAPPATLCVEVRQGRVHVFLPPLERLEHAVELLAAIETAAAGLVLPVVIEGYPLPRDPRLREVAIGPDPGVIEVNVQPAASWPELVDIVTTVYGEARRCRLATEKFQLDGSHTGTGGGNHMTLGGPTAADSPLLRRPDLLRSLITYWQHHPSLSYLFSGRFIGPTSQAPRVDEARHDSLYELEIAFAQLNEADMPPHPPRPWLVDRLLRNLLVDVAGNTHRAEFCIDKLFNPDGERGRLGLVELRAFEMPPHPQMALVQALLVRSLVARFWQHPYAGDLVRWGGELHDRFLLPWYVAADIDDVLGDLHRHGLPFDQTWLAPFLEFRFPRLGSVQVAGTTIELRSAIEPWPVLGEEVGATSTARYVDSSTERLQVLVSDLTDARHVVTCNGRPLPLHPTGRPDTFVAGVRYKAWQPPSGLHPTIGVHAPLVVDLVDRWSGRALGGCTYHVSHPGGRSYERLPVNANEAEARRTSRFEARGHTPGPVDVTALDVALHGLGADRDYPRTLDLRRAPRTSASPDP
jgi:uncharacterized protein (DUF2126 family)/transglutaminase-like putative cysteine protease